MSKSNKVKSQNAMGAKSQRKALRSAAPKSQSETSPARAATLGKAVARSASKVASVVAMLRRPKGATIEQLVKTTGWQAHSVRGAISGALKKRRGLVVTSEAERGGARVYRIVG